jgi:hypothetical protein
MTRGGLVKTGEQIDETALPGATGTREAKLEPLRNFERNLLQNVGMSVIEINLFEV